MKVAIIKYNAGNIQSVDYALRRIGVEPVITADFSILKSADRVIFPGVGEASSTMRHLRQTGLSELIPTLTQPVLGICLGMQLLCRHSDEGNVKALGIMDTDIVKFAQENTQSTSQQSTCKVPHMGWNRIEGLRGALFNGVEDGAFMYFVHSYYAVPCEQAIATCRYITPFAAALQHNNFYATQFHPEKSGNVGEQILRNFITLP